MKVFCENCEKETEGEIVTVEDTVNDERYQAYKCLSCGSLADKEMTDEIKWASSTSYNNGDKVKYGNAIRTIKEG